MHLISGLNGMWSSMKFTKCILQYCIEFFEDYHNVPEIYESYWGVVLPVFTIILGKKKTLKQKIFEICSYAYPFCLFDVFEVKLMILTMK